MKQPIKRPQLSHNLTRKIWNQWCDATDKDSVSYFRPISVMIERFLKQDKRVKRITKKLVAEYIQFYRKDNLADKETWWYLFLR